MEQIPPFYVGQKVVALRTHSQGLFKKGQEFTIVSINIPKCKCYWRVHIGINNPFKYLQCSDCGEYHQSGVCYFAADMFADITSQFQTISYTRVMETEAPLIGVN